MYWFPEDEREQCFKTAEQILGVLSQPLLIGRSRSCYTFEAKSLTALMKL